MPFLKITILPHMDFSKEKMRTIPEEIRDQAVEIIGVCASAMGRGPVHVDDRGCAYFGYPEGFDAMQQVMDDGYNLGIAMAALHSEEFAQGVPFAEPSFEWVLIEDMNDAIGIELDLEPDDGAGSF